ncbi:hypothetical protein, partial [Hydrococcus rivularis]|uniref:hypothetical protein n=1 Tax=Hydrococcus rivularis TaxID=1616834 RepID=UPI001FE334E1
RTGRTSYRVSEGCDGRSSRAECTAAFGPECIRAGSAASILKRMSEKSQTKPIASASDESWQLKSSSQKWLVIPHNLCLNADTS